MKRLWIAIFIIFSVDWIDVDTAIANGALKYVKISKGINSKRRLGIHGAIEKGYSWESGSQYYTVLMAIDSKWYNKNRGYNKKKRSGVSNIFPMVREGTNALQNLVREFNRIMPRRWSAEKKVNFVLAFVQSLPYTRDVVGTGYDEYFKYAIETLVEGGGDCEDTSVLLASILNGLSYKVALIDLPRHIAVGVKGKFRGTSFRYGKDQYYYCETTNSLFKLGEVPTLILGQKATIIPITSTPVPPIHVVPKIVEPKPTTLKRPSPIEILEQGIELYEQARFNEAIKSLRSALRGLKDLDLRASAHLYLGFSKRGFGENDKLVSDEFQQALRHHPNRTLPPRIGVDHPIFKPLIEKVRSRTTGRLTITSSLPQTQIWIAGNLFERKMLGTGTVSLRLFKGNYIVEGIHDSFTRKLTVQIEPGEEESLYLKLPPILNHDTPSKTLIGESIPFSLNLVSRRKPNRVEIRYRILDRNGAELKQDNVEMHLRKERPGSSTWNYRAELPPQNDVGKVEYLIVADEGRSPKSGHHHVPIEEDEHDRKEFADELKEIEDSWKRIHATNSAARFSVNDQLDAAESTINSAETAYNIHKFNRYQNTASEQINKARESVDALVTSAPNDEQELDNLLNSLSHTETDAKVNRRLSESFIETTTTSLRDKIQGTRDTLNASGDMQIRLDKQESQLAKVVKEFKPLHQGIWASFWSNVVSKDETSTSDPGGGDMFSLIYLREGKTHRARGVQLDLSYQNPVNTSVTGLWEPDLDLSKLRENAMALTLLGGIARYGINSNQPGTNQATSEESPHTTPIIGVGLQLHPEHRVTVDLKGTIKLQSANDDDRFINKHLYHYEVGVRLYIAPALNLRVGYGQWRLGSRDVTGLQIGLGALF